MANFCRNCGNRLEEGARFCPACGAPLSAEQPRAAEYTSRDVRDPQYSEQPGRYTDNGASFSVNAPGAPRIGVPLPGFSDRVNDPEINAAVKKNRGAAKIFALVFVPLPILGTVIYSLAGGDLELSKALIYGGVISAVFLIFALVGFARDSARNSYEAVVTDKISRLTYRHKNSEDSEMVTKYTTVVRTTDGKKKKIVEFEGSQIYAWNYLNSGDRFRFHPQFAFPYELYDKSHASYIVCVGCGTKNPVEADRCKRCKLPLLK